MPEIVHVPDVDETAKLMTQGQWMKGCPEGSEQGFLFSEYHELTEGECSCPHGCGTKVARHKRDFFALFVSRPFNLPVIMLTFRSPSGLPISLT